MGLQLIDRVPSPSCGARLTKEAVHIVGEMTERSHRIIVHHRIEYLVSNLTMVCGVWCVVGGVSFVVWSIVCVVCRACRVASMLASVFRNMQVLAFAFTRKATCISPPKRKHGIIVQHNNHTPKGDSHTNQQWPRKHKQSHTRWLHAKWSAPPPV